MVSEVHVALAFSFAHTVGVVAGALIVGLGAFVLLARPASPLHRFFFVLALVDGLGTMTLQLAGMSDDMYGRAVFSGAYWHFQIAFVTLLVAFGLLFPRPLVSERVARRLAVGACLVGAATLALYVRDHSLFLFVRPIPSPYPFFNQGGGNVVQAVFALGVGFIATKLTWEIVRGGSESYRRQAAYVLGGMTLAYAPYPAASVAGGLRIPDRTFFSADPSVVFAYWTFAFVLLALVAIAVVLVRERTPERMDERAFVLACLGGVVVMTVLTAKLPTAGLTYVAQRLGLVAYPLLLAYAIARYEVFDINAKMRRAATWTLVAASTMVLFVLVENVIENLVAERLSGIISSELAAGSLAAIGAAVVWGPVTRRVESGMRRILPDPSEDDLLERKREIYRHGLEGALADGILQERESRTLTVLRESLGLTVEDHQRILAELHASRHAAAPAPVPV